MDIEKYGIYLAYQPTVDLRKEGLGHYLVSFLKGGASIDGVRFVVVCPSWSVKALQELCEANQLDPDTFDILSPDRQSYALRAYLKLLSMKKSSRRSSLGRLSDWLLKNYSNLAMRAEKYALAASSPLNLVLASPAIVFCGLNFIFGLLSIVLLRALRIVNPRRISFVSKVLSAAARFRRTWFSPVSNPSIQRLYPILESQETTKMKEICDNAKDVRAWYCPTSFWPSFNELKGPKLMCVPDVVLSDFPVDFARIGGSRFVSAFNKVETAIMGASNFVTYSEEIKNRTLVKRYGFSHSDVFSVKHAPMRLDQNLPIFTHKDLGSTAGKVCRRLVSQAFSKSDFFPFGNVQPFKFIFYASQLRPNKNVLTLLKAYKLLRDTESISHKLVLSGDVELYHPVKEYIKDNSLERYIVSTPGLTIEELSAMYYMADIAVNPSLSEGGAPFTYTEALSVGTPIVMSRIPVTEEVITDVDVQKLTFFNPLSHIDIAEKILFAVDNRAKILEFQLKFYNKLISRSWLDVTREHVNILRQISEV